MSPACLTLCPRVRSRTVCLACLALLAQSEWLSRKVCHACIRLGARDWLTLCTAKWLIWAWQLTEDLGWRPGNWILWPRPGHHPLKTIGRKVKPIPCLPVASRKTSRTCWIGLKSAGGLLLCFFFLFGFSLFFPFFFLPPSETIRHGVMKGPETDQKGEHKANPQNWDKCHFAIL